MAPLFATTRRRRKTSEMSCARPSVGLKTQFCPPLSRSVLKQRRAHGVAARRSVQRRSSSNLRRLNRSTAAFALAQPTHDAGLGPRDGARRGAAPRARPRAPRTAVKRARRAAAPGFRGAATRPRRSREPRTHRRPHATTMARLVVFSTLLTVATPFQASAPGRPTTALARVGRADHPWTGRGAAAAATWIFRGDEPRRRSRTGRSALR